MVETKDPQERQKLIILALVGLLYSIGVAYLVQSLPTAGFTSDFFPRWYASRTLLTTGRSLYDGANAYEVMQMTGWPFTNQLGYYYPAYLLLFTAPLSVIPYGVAHIIWTVFGLWCLWSGTVIFARSLKLPLSINRLTLLLVLVSISVPVLQHTLNAQFNTLGVLALALTYRALRQEKYFMAGVWASGLLLKPQATLLPILFFLAWSTFKPERRLFWVGLALVGIILWGIAEALEPGWAIHFWRALRDYVPVQSVLDRVWNSYQLISLTLVLLTAWLVFRRRHLPAEAVGFSGLLGWTINLNALIIPMYGMLHMVLMGPVFVILLNGTAILYPRLASWIWMGTIGLFVAGLLAFVIPLLMIGPTGLQITTAELIYRFTMPTLLCLASLPLIFNFRRIQSVGVA